MSSPCAGCGAPVEGQVCHYCGRLLDPAAAPAAQGSALDEFHRAVAAAPPEAGIALLQNGFLPDDPAVLREAGLRCIPLFNAHESRQDRLGPAAVRRLRAVAAKLRIQGAPESLRAAAEFDREIARYKRAGALNLAVGFAILGALAASLVWAARRFFGGGPP